MQKCNHVIEHEYNGIGVASCPIYLKADVLESCARFSPSRGVCPVVEQTWVCCASVKGEESQECVGAVKRVFFPRNFVNKAIET